MDNKVSDLHKYYDHWNQGVKFVFAFDEVDPSLLHIFARHLVTPEIAIKTWWEGDKEVWNEKHRRYETSSNTHTIYWFWLKKDKVVMVITCF